MAADMDAPGPDHFDYSKLREDRVFISLCGLIGAGKSTLTRALADLLSMPAYYEEVTGNEYLADFYKDMKTHAFPMQIYLLTQRFRQQQKIIWNGEGGVQDRSIYEDSIFARMLTDAGFMSERELRTYQDLFNSMSNFMRRPHMIVYLRITPDVSLERIRRRSRDCESGITIEYLRALFNAYESFVRDISRSIPVVTVDWSEFRKPDEMARAIAREYARIHNVRNATFDASIGRVAGAPPTSPTTVAKLIERADRVASDDEEPATTPSASPLAESDSAGKHHAAAADAVVSPPGGGSPLKS